MIGKYIIITTDGKDFFKDIDGNLKYFDDINECHRHIGIYELENVYICRVEHKE